eukprot:jgi/Galph1/2698/GphlegSOOS_G1375.1
MNVTVVLPEVAQRSKNLRESVLDNCSSQGDTLERGKGDKRELHRVLQELCERQEQQDSMKEPVVVESRSGSESSWSHKVCREEVRDHEFSPFSPKKSLGPNRNFSPEADTTSNRMRSQERVVTEENRFTSPYQSLFLDTSSLTEDLKNIDLTSSDDDEDDNDNRTVSRGDEKTEDNLSGGLLKSVSDVADNGVPTELNSVQKVAKKRSATSASYPMFTVRPFHYETRDLSTKELEDTVRSSVLEADKNTSSLSQATNTSLHGNVSESMQMNNRTQVAQNMVPLNTTTTSNTTSPPAPWMTRWKTRMCKFYPMGMCKNGTKCSFAHSAEELREPDSTYSYGNPVNQYLLDARFPENLSRPLNEENLAFYKGDPMLSHIILPVSNGNNYATSKPESISSFGFARSYSADQNSSTSLEYGSTSSQGKSVPPAPWMTHYKTKMCKFFSAGECKNGDRCSFAHSSEELREPPPPELDEERRRRHLRKQLQLQQWNLLNERNSTLSSLYQNQGVSRDSDLQNYEMQMVGMQTDMELPKKNFVSSHSSPQLRGYVNIPHGFHKSSSFSYLDLGNHFGSNEPSSVRAGTVSDRSMESHQSFVTGVGEASIESFVPINAFSNRGSHSLMQSAADAERDTMEVSRRYSSSSVTEPLSSKPSTVLEEEQLASYVTKPCLISDPVNRMQTPQDDIWDEIDRDILHAVFDEDVVTQTGSKSTLN